MYIYPVSFLDIFGEICYSKLCTISDLTEKKVKMRITTRGPPLQGYKVMNCEVYITKPLKSGIYTK